MKKFVIGFILGSLITGTVGAAAQYILTPITYDITVNGKSLKDEQYPMLNLNGTTYLSLRKTCEAVGATLYWNEATKTAELTTNNNTSSVEVTSSGSVIMKSELFTLREEPIMYVIHDNEYYIEISAFAQYLSADASNVYIKIPGKADLTLPKQEGSDKLKTGKTVIEYLNFTYVRLADLNLTTELKDNVLWLK
ncbi:stalk domain-containing protein [Acetivibrio clariflavus]|uniref:Copper amine oxidase family protein n=1 Tax=Acetivibrio clariflavus (strain DSM 19732 / NBRC 101661 / EBR45) TaxID=720554 RepID=G8LSH9_ACECE|nr:stalk domain-containing protein [Acetivibrio clariflavus]AEV68283.1 copper amine oxidase family protein [Acetivibrio clariflavus DSM 19732]